MKKVLFFMLFSACSTAPISADTALIAQDVRAYNDIIDAFTKGTLSSITPDQASILITKKTMLSQELKEHESSLLGKISKIAGYGFFLGIIGLLVKGTVAIGLFSEGWPYSNSYRWEKAKRNAENPQPPYNIFSKWILEEKAMTESLTPKEQASLAWMNQQQKTFELSKDEIRKQTIREFEQEYGKEKPKREWDSPKNIFITPFSNFLTISGLVSLPFVGYDIYYTDSTKQEIAKIDEILSKIVIVSINVSTF